MNLRMLRNVAFFQKFHEFFDDFNLGVLTILNHIFMDNFFVIKHS